MSDSEPSDAQQSDAKETDLALDKLRAQIDDIDLRIQTLINDRAKCAQQVAKVKLSQFQGLSRAQQHEQVQFYRPEREAQVLRRIMERNQGPLEAQEMAYIFRAIMSSCLALEQPMTVSYLGPEGTFTQAAAVKHFGHGVICRPGATIAMVFSQVEAREVNYGIVPVENSTEGMVTHTLDNFMASPLKICGEVELPIKMHLLINKNTSAEKIKTICAHQQAFGQCRNWINKNWPKVEIISVSSNGEAARMASETDDVAAIAGDMAVEYYELVKLSENIHDFQNNTTRFLIIGREEIACSGNDKTSIIVSTHNKPGALFVLLEPFHHEGVMLTRIDTRPSPTETWAYVFFIEFEGHKDDPKIQSILAKLEEHSLLMKPLGSYPRAVM